MKLYVAIFALISTAAADVSHLSREYLPPVHHDSGASASLGGPVVVNVGSSAGSSAGPSGTTTYTSHHQSFESVQQPQKVTVHSVTYGSVKPQAAEPAAPEPAAPEPAAPADVAAVSSVTYGHDGPQQPIYQGGEQGKEQVNLGVVSEGADVGVDVQAGNGDAGVSHGISYDLSSQDGGVQDLGHNSLLGDDLGSNAVVDNETAHVSLAAAHGPAVHASQSASVDTGAQDAVVQYVSGGVSASTDGIDTQYGANGGYVY